MGRRGRADASPFQRHVYRIVRQIPRGRVATYGQIAAILGHPRAARAVGQALRLLPGPLIHSVPWQRVVNAAGGISRRGDLERPERQRQLLEREGVPFTRSGRLPLDRLRWHGPNTEERVALRVDLPLIKNLPVRRRARRA